MEDKPGAEIAVHELPNLRDLGGWLAGGGRRVRTGLIFRSTHLGCLDKTGLNAVGRFDLHTVVDLRTAAERQALPDRLPIGATQVVCDVLEGAPSAAPAQLPELIANPQRAELIFGGGKAEELFKRGYREFISLPSAIASYRDLLSILADTKRRPVLFHCATGKDRTGWAAAIILTALGVSPGDVLRDYLLTNEQLLPELKPVFDQFEASGGDRALLEAVLGVRSAYIAAAFDEVELHYGSMEGYLVKGLGLDADARQHLRNELTEEVA